MCRSEFGGGYENLPTIRWKVTRVVVLDGMYRE